ncbi:MAG: FAD-binding oxidoreductase [Acidimicrobiia bacterium]
MLQPTTTAQVSEAIDGARRAGVPLSIRGSAKLDAAEGETAISTTALDSVIEYRPEDLTIAVGAGMTLEQLDAELGPHGQTAVLPETSPGRTVGGVVATAASGYRRLKYGPTRDRVLGVTVATGYGEIAHGGGQLVKNVTGYDLPRLLTGSFGSLGIITEVIFKLWPNAPHAATYAIEQPGLALQTVFRPLAVLETETGSFLYADGSEAGVTNVQEALSDNAIGHDVTEGLLWPEEMDTAVVLSVRVPPRSLVSAVEVVRDSGAERWIAQHGVGVVECGFAEMSSDGVAGLRTSIAALGGFVVIEDGSADLGDRWGMVPGTQQIQQRLKSLFDPDGVCNPGALPGGL